MKTPTRFIESLSQEQRLALNHLMRNHPSYRTRTRAHAILLSARRSSINQIADIFAVDRETVTARASRGGKRLQLRASTMNPNVDAPTS